MTEMLLDYHQSSYSSNTLSIEFHASVLQLKDVRDDHMIGQ